MKQQLPKLERLTEMLEREIGFAVLHRFSPPGGRKPVEYLLRHIADDEYDGNQAVLPLFSEGVEFLFRSGLIATAVNTGYPGHRVLVTTRKGEAALKDGIPVVDAASEQETGVRSLLHPKLAHAYSELTKGADRYGRALNEAFTEVEILVRERTGLAEDGAALLRTAFRAETGPLSDPKMHKNEAEGLAHLYAGAIQYAKNPGSHRRVTEFDKESTLRLLLLASELLYKAERAPLRGAEPIANQL